MTRTLISTTAFALAALAGCGGETPVGPAEHPGRPSLSSVGPGDRNGNGWICGRRVSQVAPGDVDSYAMPGYVFVDDRNGVCPGGFSRMSPP